VGDDGATAEFHDERQRENLAALERPGHDARNRESIAMRLPDHVPVSPEAARAIAVRHGLGDRSLVRLADTGIINAVYLLGDDLVLRVPRDHPAHVAQARAEAAAIPVARAAGVRTPALIAYDDTCDLLPVTYLVVERVHGQAMSKFDLDPAETPDVWREVGRDLALLHTSADHAGPVGEVWVRPDPRELVEQRAADGWFTTLEARWLGAWLERVAVAALPGPAVERLLHRDAQATNVIVGQESLAYVAILDWGCAGRGDPAWDFFGMPLRAVPFLLEGHREVAPLDSDDTAEARILWRHVQWSLAHLPRGAVPGQSWGERPLAWLLEVLRFFLDGPPPPWRALAP
jgi:aminoglycoside phosphotransferase (APT) family kinase protein